MEKPAFLAGENALCDSGKFRQTVHSDDDNEPHPLTDLCERVRINYGNYTFALYAKNVSNKVSCIEFFLSEPPKT